MERETKKISTPSGVEVEIKTYMTARERNELRSVYLQNAKVDVTSQTVGDLSANVVDEAEKKLIQIMVVSFGQKKDEILDAILDGSPEDYDYIVKELDVAAQGGFQAAK